MRRADSVWRPRFWVWALLRSGWRDCWDLVAPRRKRCIRRVAQSRSVHRRIFHHFVIEFLYQLGAVLLRLLLGHFPPYVERLIEIQSAEVPSQLRSAVPFNQFHRLSRRDVPCSCIPSQRSHVELIFPNLFTALPHYHDPLAFLRRRPALAAALLRLLLGSALRSRLVDADYLQQRLRNLPFPKGPVLCNKALRWDGSN